MTRSDWMLLLWLLQCIMLFTWIDYKPSTYNDYEFPLWADVMGWMMTMSSVVAIPVVMVYQIWRAPNQGSLFKVSPPHLLFINASYFVGKALHVGVCSSGTMHPCFDL